MIQTFKGLRDRVTRLLDDNSATTVAIVNDALNYAHQQRCCEFPWTFMLWPREETLTTVVGQVRYTLHYEWFRPYYVWNRTTSSYVQEVPMQTLRPEVVRPTGSAQQFQFAGTDCVAAQPTVAGPLRLVSSSASDTAQEDQVAIKGVRSDGSVVAEVVTPSGINWVPTANSFVQVLGITKATEWTGTLTLRDTADVELVSLLPSEMGRRYPVIELLQTPDAPEVLAYRFYKQPLVLINDYDIPEIPPPSGQILVWDALIQMSAYLTELPQAKLATWQRLQYEAQIALYQAWANEQQSVLAAPQYVRSLDDDRAL